ncbi:LysR family transcriptional regulator [Breznakiella homolactica]|uniref:LysR family transcriptional regulator n=1 Tax=Breznakiella homolactica TaxID=2798577 RepID=A0A7T8B8W1_9SPIR|nr:LysR family transcriptional regulator [Breznakiella homolactica]QQO07731.1 LysR family transcriptional regulator [Breznakiella homolactica]
MESSRCKAFLTAAETGSFSKAAEILYYTPSGVSQLVNALEADLGFPLLRRNKKGVTLTSEGEKILPVVREFLMQENRIYQLAAEMKDLAIGNVTIAAYSSIATHWLPGVIRVFQEDYPRITIKLMEGIRQEVSRWLEEKIADLAFLSYQDPMPYDWIPLAEDPMLAVLPRNHPLAAETSYPIKNCRNERFIMPALGRDDDVVTLFERNNVTPNIRFSTLENFAALAMIEQGLGMSVMNELITRRWHCDVVKLPLDPPQHITLGIAVPSLKNASPAVKRFVRYAEERLAVRSS